MRVELFLAGRYLRPKRNMVSLFTVFSLIGVMLGVAVVMIVLAVMTGFTDQMKRKLIETQAHFQVRAPGSSRPVRDYRPIVKEIKAAGADAAPVIMQPVLLQYQARVERPGAPVTYGRAFDARSIIIGADREVLASRLNLDKSLKAGKLEFSNDPDASLDARGIVIGGALARRLKLRVGDKVVLHSSNRLLELVKFSADGSVKANDSGSAYIPPEFTVTGIYSLGKYDFDNSVMFIDYGEAADLFDLKYTSATRVFGWGKNPFDQKALISDLRTRISKLRTRIGGPEYEVVTWEEDNGRLLEVLNVEKRMMFFLLIFIVLVAAFCTTITLITTVYQKTREIGLLKALGASDRAVTMIFLGQGLLIGIIGSISGIALGGLVIHFRNHIMRFVSKCTGMELFPKEFYYFNELPAHIVWQDVAIIAVVSIVLCTLGAVLPARRAARLDPARALRYE